MLDMSCYTFLKTEGRVGSDAGGPEPGKPIFLIVDFLRYKFVTYNFFKNFQDPPNYKI